MLFYGKYTLSSSFIFKEITMKKNHQPSFSLRLFMLSLLGSAIAQIEPSLVYGKQGAQDLPGYTPAYADFHLTDVTGFALVVHSVPKETNINTTELPQGIRVWEAPTTVDVTTVSQQRKCEVKETFIQPRVANPETSMRTKFHLLVASCLYLNVAEACTEAASMIYGLATPKVTAFFKTIDGSTKAAEEVQQGLIEYGEKLAAQSTYNCASL